MLVKINQLFTKGVHIQSSQFSGKKIVKAKLLMAVFDLPAKAGATNFLQFNGHHSCLCLYCIDKGGIDKYSYQMKNMSHEAVPLLNNMKGKQRRKEDQFLV